MDRILKILEDNARLPLEDIAAMVDKTPEEVAAAIDEYAKSGIIKGYTVRVDAKALGNDVTALMEISLEHPRFHDSFTEVIMDHPNILDCYYLTGDYDFVLKISCASSDELERIHRTIKSIPGVSATRTHFVLKEIKNMYSAIPEEEKKRF